MATPVLPTLNSYDDSEQTSISTTSPLTASSREQSRRGRSYTASSTTSIGSHHQRSFGTTSPPPQDLNAPGPSLEQTFTRRPSQGLIHNRQPSQPPSASGTSSSPSRRNISQDGTPPGIKPVLRTKESPNGGVFVHSGTSESVAVSRKGSAIEQFPVYDSRVAPNINGQMTNANVDRSHIEKMNKDLRLQMPHNGRAADQPELETVGEFASEHLFHSFVTLADQKIVTHCSSTKLLGPEPNLDAICGPGVDSKFDQLLSSLGYIVRNKPKPLVDKMISWRQLHSESTNNSPSDATQAAKKSGGLADQNNLQSPSQPGVPSKMPAFDAELVAKERKNAVATYILCRALIEILSRTTLGSLTLDVVQKLERIVYDNQLQNLGRESLEKSPMKNTKWIIATQLVGVLGDLDFEGVSNRFLRDLRHHQKDLGVKNYLNKEAEEAELAHVVKSMRHLRLNPDNDLDWQRACFFMQSIADLFNSVHGTPPKISYCRLIGSLLLSCAEKCSSSYDRPLWRKAVATFSEKLSQLANKPKYWQSAFPVQAALCCVSTSDVFASKFHQLTGYLSSKVKERQNRATLLKATCQLVWSYIQRSTDNMNTQAKTLEDIGRMVCFPAKRYPLSEQPAVAEALIQLIRIIGFHFQEITFKTIVFPLINSDALHPGVEARDLKVEQLDPDRMVIGIRSFLTILSDLEKKEQPPFPATFDDDRSNDQFITGNAPIGTKPRSSSRKPSIVKAERLSKPVITTGLSEVAKEYYGRFCEILGKITIICDNAFGGQAVLDEKFSASAPKTPVAESWGPFGRKDDAPGPGEERLGFYDLLHVAIQALPRSLSTHTPLNPLLNLLCTGTAHVEKNIAISSATSLKSIAKQGHAQIVTAKFSGFILNYDNRYSTMSDGGMLGPNHIEDTLKLYLELLHIWIEELHKVKENGTSQSDDTSAKYLEKPSTLLEVDRVESHGLFFLCSPSPRVRAFAVEVLDIVTKLDNALGKSPQRIIEVLEGKFGPFMDSNDERLSIAERSRLEKATSSANPRDALVDLCTGTGGLELDLWYKLFPKLIQVTFLHFPLAVTQTKGDVCGRLFQMQTVIEAMEERPRGLQAPSMDGNSSWIANRSSDLNLEQWKLYLMFACTTITETGIAPAMNETDPSHARKNSKSSQANQEAFKTAVGLFSNVVPMLAFQNQSVRHAAVIGLGSININLYRTLLESLDSYDRARVEEQKKNPSSHQRAASSPRRFQQHDHFLFEAAYLHMLTSHFLRVDVILRDEWILDHLSTYTRDLAHFLQRAEDEPGFLRLRLHFCGLVEGVFLGVGKTIDPHKWMSFQTRRAAFVLMEGWCGFSTSQDKASSDNSSIKQLNQPPELRRGPGSSTAMGALANERKLLRNAALSAMATLCAGPISVKISGTTHSFEAHRMFQWFGKLVNSDGDKMPAIGRRALKNLLTYNSMYPQLMERLIGTLYHANTPKGLESYVEVISDIYMSDIFPQVPFWKLLSALLFVLAANNSAIRVKCAKLLRAVDEKQGKNTKLRELDIGISDKTTAVNRKAHYEISHRLANQYPEHAHQVFSELSAQFNDLNVDQQRNMVFALLPWLKTIELVIDSSNNGVPTTGSRMILMNLLEMTVNCSNILHHEVQAIWQALATGPYPGNVQVVLDFIIDFSLSVRDQKIVEIVRQIVVYLSDTEAGQNVTEYLYQRITPKQMCLPEKENPKEVTAPSSTSEFYPYFAEINAISKDSGKQVILREVRKYSKLLNANLAKAVSLSQLCLILLVDLIVAPVTLSVDWIPTIVQAVLVLWDHYTAVLQDQAREMLVHLIHELIISHMHTQDALTNITEVQLFVDLVRQRDPKVLWNYEDNDGIDSGYEPPKQMVYVVTEVVKIFSIRYPTFEAAWGKTTLDWSTTCPVRHLACRSLQTYRCILKPFDQKTLCDLLWRLSVTVSDWEGEIQAYAIELMRTIRTVLARCEPTDTQLYPPLFWTVCSCLSTTNELEFQEALSILDLFLENFDLADPVVLARVTEVKPEDWQWVSQDLTSLIYKGCKSGKSLDKSLRMLDRLIRVPSNHIVGDDSRLLFTVLANLPRLSNAFRQSPRSPHTVAAAGVLATAANEQGCPHLSRVLYDFANSRYQNDRDFISQILSSIDTAFFPRFSRDSLVFLMGFLTSSSTWFKMETLNILGILLQNHDMQIAGSSTSEFVGPLLRLLQSDLCPQALQVLDRMAMLSGTSKPGLQPSASNSRPEQPSGKEVERADSIYGIPEYSGWSIPMPAIHKLAARNNLNATFNTLSRNPENASAAPTPDFEFYKDRHPGSYFPNHSTGMTSDEAVLALTTMNELTSKIDALDDFFEADGFANSPPHSGVANSIASTPLELSRQNTLDISAYPQNYSNVTSHPMRNASFSSNFSDSSNHPPPREPAVMSPSAFSASPKAPTRPGMAPRSITSPATNQSTPVDKTFNVPHEDIETFSDDDLSAGRTSTSDRSIALDASTSTNRTVGRKGSFRAGMRSSLKRLTGGSDKHRTVRGGAEDSPEVPKVPDVYLQNPKSSDM